VSSITDQGVVNEGSVQPDGAQPRFVFLGLPDVNGALRGKALTEREFAAVVRRGQATMTDLLLALDPVDEPITDYETLGIRSGAGDLTIVPELDTLSPMSWRPGWQLCLATPLWADGTLCDLGSRNVLRRALDALAELGLEAMASFEYEVRFTHLEDGAPLCRPLSYSLGELAPFEGVAAELARALEALGVELSAVHTEAGPGLLEINLGASRGIRAADEAVLVKAAVKDVARSMGMKASFLAKTHPLEEGSSGHLHVSLWDGEANAFADGMDGRMAAAVAGALDHMPAASLLYNPNLNSYKRLVPGYFAPVNATWGSDNRSAAVRVIAGGPPSAARIELRRPGADANPYLALAGAIASVVLGLRAGSAPPERITGDATEAGDALAPPLPGSLESAIEAFSADVELRELLGPGFAAYYETSRRWELRAWQRAVTDWERERYEGTV
jgi:glutamine synthetase